MGMKMRDMITIVEAPQRRKLYHGSRKRFPPGFILTAQKDGYVHANAGDELDELIRTTEQILERYRPEGELSRYESVFMTDSPESVEPAGGRPDHIYVVEPLGPIFYANLYWYGQIEQAAYDIDAYDPEELREWALNYWTAKPSGQRETYEYRTVRARIVRELRGAR